MKTRKNLMNTLVAASLIALGALSTAQAQTQTKATKQAASASQKMVPALLEELARYQAAEKLVDSRIATFDTLDFDVFTNQKWDRLHESHAKDIVVHWPDGHQTKGIDVHIDDLKAMFVYAPDTRIETHPVKFGKGEWTSVIGVMEGTFSKPMPIGEGKFIQPTGKKFKITMSTVGQWKDGKMVAEYLFWDNATYMKQIGLGQ